MKEQFKRLIRKSLKLKGDNTLKFYTYDFIFRKMLRQNAEVKWAVHHTSTIHCPQKIKTGINVYPGDSPCNYIEASNGIEIGDFTNIGPNVGIISANHNLINNALHESAPPVKIGAFCWIGMNAVILPAVELGDFTIVGAGTVVSKSFPEGYCVLGGNPAKIIKTLDPEECERFRKQKYGEK